MELGLLIICIIFAILFGIKLVQLLIFENKEEERYDEEFRRGRKTSDSSSEEE